MLCVQGQRSQSPLLSSVVGRFFARVCTDKGINPNNALFSGMHEPNTWQTIALCATMLGMWPFRSQLSNVLALLFHVEPYVYFNCFFEQLRPCITEIPSHSRGKNSPLLTFRTLLIQWKQHHLHTDVAGTHVALFLALLNMWTVRAQQSHMLAFELLCCGTIADFVSLQFFYAKLHQLLIGNANDKFGR
jgi:hypothetical protein